MLGTGKPPAEMYTLLPSLPTPGLPCFAVYAAGPHTVGSAERLAASMGPLLDRPAVRVLLRYEGGAERAWAPLAQVLARRTRVQRLALVGRGSAGPDTACCKRYDVADRAAAWAWLRGAVPPAPVWGAPLLPAYAVVPMSGSARHELLRPAVVPMRPAVVPRGDSASLETLAPSWPLHAGRSAWEVPMDALERSPDVLLAAALDGARAFGGYRGEW